MSVLDSAVAPLKPASNTAPMILLAGHWRQPGFAILLAILLDLFDKRFRYPEQATHELGLDILGTIPTIRRGKNGATRMEDEAQLVEAFRGLRLNVRNAANGSGPVTLAISSPGPGDGKSLDLVEPRARVRRSRLSHAARSTATSVAASCTRRSAVPQRPGLVDHLTGDVVDRGRDPRDDAREPVRHPVRHAPPPRAGAARGGRDGEDDSRASRSRFDAIIVDTAPLGAGIDPYALGAAAGTMLLVLRTGQTDRKLAQAKLTTLDRLPVRLIGAVLNDIQAEGMYKYYSYLDGYGTLDEDEEPRLVQAGGGSSLPARATKAPRRPVAPALDGRNASGADRRVDRPRFVVLSLRRSDSACSRRRSLVHEAERYVLERRDPCGLASLHMAERRRRTQQQLHRIDRRLREIRNGAVAGAQLQMLAARPVGVGADSTICLDALDEAHGTVAAVDGAMIPNSERPRCPMTSETRAVRRNISPRCSAMRWAISFDRSSSTAALGVADTATHASGALTARRVGAELLRPPCQSANVVQTRFAIQQAVIVTLIELALRRDERSRA